MSVPYRRTHLDQLDRVPLDEAVWRPIRRPLGITAFGVNGYTANAGEDVIERHDETSPGAGRHQELYFVAAGAAEFEIDGDRLTATTGTMILVEVGADRAATATEDETTVLVFGGAPGAALPVSPFEHWYAAGGPASRGDYGEAIEIASLGLAEHPEHPTLHYQLACYHALAGHDAEALDHLSIAVSQNRETVDWAAEDSDLDAIREHPRFPRPDR